jgi:ABC-type polysaccharide/polyol phosphate transport system ATPase subunit
MLKSPIGDTNFDPPMVSTAPDITRARPAAISVRNVSKTYKLYTRPIDRLYELVSGQPRHTERHSLRKVSFDVQHSEVVGIIGANGAGKSTLLRIIASRLEPTSGSVALDGSVVAILELGTGFHPDFTGRENVYLGGLCLGLTREQIRAEMENIIAFSELEDVIDTPFRTYSTGMQARLTFATAVAVNPDILIIDEALSVGDNRFQLKSFNKIRSFKEAGNTILLVTHSMSSVATFCDRAVLLHKGEVVADGEPNWVTNVYHNLQFGDLAIERALAQRPSARSSHQHGGYQRGRDYFERGRPSGRNRTRRPKRARTAVRWCHICSAVQADPSDRRARRRADDPSQHARAQQLRACDAGCPAAFRRGCQGNRSGS